MLTYSLFNDNAGSSDGSSWYDTLGTVVTASPKSSAKNSQAKLPDPFTLLTENFTWNFNPTGL